MPFDMSTKRRAKSLLSPQGVSWSSANNNGILFKNVQTQTLYDLKFKLLTYVQPQNLRKSSLITTLKCIMTATWETAASPPINLFWQ